MNWKYLLKSLLLTLLSAIFVEVGSLLFRSLRYFGSFDCKWEPYLNSFWLILTLIIILICFLKLLNKTSQILPLIFVIYMLFLIYTLICSFTGFIFSYLLWPQRYIAITPAQYLPGKYQSLKKAQEENFGRNSWESAGNMHSKYCPILEKEILKEGYDIKSEYDELDKYLNADEESRKKIDKENNNFLISLKESSEPIEKKMKEWEKEEREKEKKIQKMDNKSELYKFINLQGYRMWQTEIVLGNKNHCNKCLSEYFDLQYSKFGLLKLFFIVGPGALLEAIVRSLDFFIVLLFIQIIFYAKTKKFLLYDDV